ncbi:MAG: hypothetical protein IKW91_09680, partial [Bacteroidaceae bacterium]|nr:hypothetical protein [Bacteroidaceae bacterium]
MKERSLILSLVCCFLFAVCSCKDGEVNRKYCNLPARLNIENVLQAPVLYTCCESWGEFCTVTSDGQRFIFTDASNHTSAINIVGLVGYSGYTLGLSGFIVGRLSIPEIGE